MYGRTIPREYCQAMSARDQVLAEFIARRGELLGYLAGLLPAHLIDDAFQETFLVVLRRADDFDARRDLGAWARGIARFVALKVRRRHGAHQPLPDAILALVDTAHEEAAADGEVADDLHRLRQCLHGVAPGQRELLRRRYHDGQPLSELARAVGRSEGAVQVALSRLRAALLDCILRARKAGA